MINRKYSKYTVCYILLAVTLLLGAAGARILVFKIPDVGYKISVAEANRQHAVAESERNSSMGQIGLIRAQGDNSRAAAAAREKAEFEASRSSLITAVILLFVTAAISGIAAWVSFVVTNFRTGLGKWYGV